MTATNIFYNFVGFRYSPPALQRLICFLIAEKAMGMGHHRWYNLALVLYYMKNKMTLCPEFSCLGCGVFTPWKLLPSLGRCN